MFSSEAEDRLSKTGAKVRDDEKRRSRQVVDELRAIVFASTR